MKSPLAEKKNTMKTFVAGLFTTTLLAMPPAEAPRFSSTSTSYCRTDGPTTRPNLYYSRELETSVLQGVVEGPNLVTEQNNLPSIQS
jgi:hypothetical protein